jgi:DNA-binding transcriptional ArsR family regulator
LSVRAQDASHLDEIFHALSDGTRRRMIERLSEGPASVSELARPFDIALPSVVKHLAVLESGGLVMSEKAGRVRTYRIAPDAIAAVESWLAKRKARWNAQFDRLDEHLASTQPAPTTRRRKRK